eukprot:Pgem_evm1s13355
MEWKNRWNAHRTTIPGLINMDGEGVSTQMMEIMHGSLYSKIQDHMMHENGLELNVRVEKNVYGLCRSAHTLINDKERWKDDVNSITRFNRDLEISKLLAYLSESLVFACAWKIESEERGSEIEGKLVQSRRAKTPFTAAQEKIIKDFITLARSDSGRQAEKLIVSRWGLVDLKSFDRESGVALEETPL